MLTSLRIQNFRSIRDASVKLGQVNLFIGPNNSGKSNFLKGIEFLSEIITLQPDTPGFSQSEFERIMTRGFSKEGSSMPYIKFSTASYYPLEDNTISIDISFFNNPGEDDITIKSSQPFSVKSGPLILKYPTGDSLPITQTIKAEFARVQRYQLDPTKFVRRTKISSEKYLNSNASNLTPFVFNLSQSHGNNFDTLLNDFRACIKNLHRIATPVDTELKGYIKLKFFDQNNTDFWAEEVSEGVLYFLALLCIIHQPDPPKLLLLEEPEKGIHPRRIKEVMDFIFELARLRDIQIILTSHSPYVVDHFADIPECISVFDRENGETVIRNAGDIITETNAALAAKGHKPISYTDSLGEHWVSGFLGGVPV